MPLWLQGKAVAWRSKSWAWIGESSCTHRQRSSANPLSKAGERTGRRGGRRRTSSASARPQPVVKIAAEPASRCHLCGARGEGKGRSWRGGHGGVERQGHNREGWERRRGSEAQGLHATYWDFLKGLAHLLRGEARLSSTTDRATPFPFGASSRGTHLQRRAAQAAARCTKVTCWRAACTERAANRANMATA